MLVDLLFSMCYGLNICVPLKFICWKCNDQGDVFVLGGRGFGRWLANEGNVFIKKKQQPRIQLIHFANSPLGSYFQFNSVQLLCRVRLFVTPWTAARQASLSITNSWSFLKLMSSE